MGDRPGIRAELSGLGRSHIVWAVVAAGWAVWASGPSWLAPAYVVAAVTAVPLFAIDVRERRLPDVLTLPLVVVTLVLLALPGQWDRWLGALLGGLALGAAYLVLHLISPRGLGFGDVKLSLTLGLLAGWHSWLAVFAAGAAAFFVAAPVSVFFLLRRERDRHIAFGPYMLVGAALVLTALRLL